MLCKSDKPSIIIIIIKLKSAFRVLLVSAICARLIKIQIRNHELADSNRKFD